MNTVHSQKKPPILPLHLKLSFPKMPEAILLLLALFVAAGSAIPQLKDHFLMGNGTYLWVELTIALQLFLSRTLRKDLRQFLTNKTLWLLVALGLLIRFRFSLFAFAHINYHGYFYILDQILPWNFRDETIPFGFTYQIFWCPFSTVIKNFGITPFFAAQAILTMGSGLLLARITQSLLGHSRYGWISLALFIVAPFQVQYAATESHFNLVLFLSLLFIYLSLLRKETADTRLDLILVPLLAFILFTRPEMYLGVPCLLIFYLYWNGSSLFKNRYRASLLCLSFLAFIFMGSLKGLSLGKTPFLDQFNASDNKLPTGYFQHLPLYIFGFIGIAWGLFLKQWRSLNLLLLMYFGIVFLTPNRHFSYWVGFYYLTYLDWVPLLGVCLLLEHLRTSFGKTSFRVASAAVLTLAIAQWAILLPKTIQPYDEQIEFNFIKNIPHAEWLSLGPPTVLTREMLHLPPRSAFPDSEFYLEFKQANASLLQTKVSHTSGMEFYYRPLNFGESRYDSIIETLGLKPYRILNFEFRRRYNAFPEGTPITIGIYQKSEPIL